MLKFILVFIVLVGIGRLAWLTSGVRSGRAFTSAKNYLRNVLCLFNNNLHKKKLNKQKKNTRKTIAKKTKYQNKNKKINI